MLSWKSWSKTIQPSSETTRLVPVARVLHPHGVRGELLIEPYLTDLRCYQRLGQVVTRTGQGVDQYHRIASMRQVGGRLLLQLEGCSSRDMAQTLEGNDLYVPREELPPPPEGEFYWFDLEGLTVYTVEGECLGRVEEFFPTGSNDVLVIRHGTQELLLPFIKDVIREVNPTSGLIQVRMVPGLL